MILMMPPIVQYEDPNGNTWMFGDLSSTEYIEARKQALSIMNTFNNEVSIWSQEVGWKLRSGGINPVEKTTCFSAAEEYTERKNRLIQDQWSKGYLKDKKDNYKDELDNIYNEINKPGESWMDIE